MNDLQVIQIAIAVFVVLFAVAFYTLSQQLTQTNSLLLKLHDAMTQPVMPPMSFQPLSFAFGMEPQQEHDHQEPDQTEPETKINIEPKLNEDTTTVEEDSKK